MTKEQLKKELKEKVKEGVKPSDLKKLKRSKSDGDLPKTKTQPLNRSQSQDILLTPEPTLKQLEDKISVLELTIETKDRELVALETENKELKKSPPHLLLTDQLKEKQTEIEQLRKRLELTHQELNSLKQNHSTLLDTNLELKHQSLKDWFKEYQKNQELDEELQENIDYASNELERQDKTISQLRTQNSQINLPTHFFTFILYTVTEHLWQEEQKK